MQSIHINIYRFITIFLICVLSLFIVACARTNKNPTSNPVSEVQNTIQKNELSNLSNHDNDYDTLDLFISILPEIIASTTITFNDSSVILQEATQPDKVVTVLNANHRNGLPLSYSFITPTNYFTLNSVTGVLTLIKEINHDVTPTFELDIIATDVNGKSAMATIVVDIERDATVYNWRLTSTWPSNYILYNIIDNAMRSTLMPKLVELSSNQLQVELIAPSILANYDVYDKVSSGAFEMGHTASAVYTNKGLANEFFTSQPFGLTEAQHTAWLAAEGQTLWDELNAQDNLIAFSAGTSGEKSLGWFRQEITRPSQINGLRWRLTGLSGEQEIARRMGANVLTHGELITLGPLYNALRIGTIDAVRYSGAIADFQDNLHTSGVFYYPAPDWAQRNVALGLYINLDKYNALPIRLQKAIRDSAELVQQEMSSQYKVQNAQALASMQALGVKIRVFPQNVLDAFEVHATNLKNEKANVDSFYNRVYESWKKFK